jgi:hypothetical protein
MFSCNYQNVPIDSYQWLMDYVISHELWNISSPYGVVVYKDVFMVVKKSKLKIVESQNEVIIKDAQDIIKEVDEMFNIYIDIDKIANIYPPIKDEIMNHLYQRVVLDGNRLK